MLEKKAADGLFKVNAFYTISAKLSGKVIEAGSPEEPLDESVCLAEADGSERQLWRLVPVEENCYKLVSKASGKALDIIAAGVSDGAWVHQWEDIPHIGSQLWLVEPAEDGCYKIKAHFTGKCLDVVGISQDTGAHLQIWEDVDGDNQKWRIEEVKAAPKKTAAKKPATKKDSVEKPEAKSASKTAAKDSAPKTAATKTAAKKPAAKKTTTSKAAAKNGISSAKSEASNVSKASEVNTAEKKGLAAEKK